MAHGKTHVELDNLRSLLSADLLSRVNSNVLELTDMVEASHSDKELDSTDLKKYAEQLQILHQNLTHLLVRLYGALDLEEEVHVDGLVDFVQDRVTRALAADLDTLVERAIMRKFNQN